MALYVHSLTVSCVHCVKGGGRHTERGAHKKSVHRVPKIWEYTLTKNCFASIWLQLAFMHTRSKANDTWLYVCTECATHVYVLISQQSDKVWDSRERDVFLVMNAKLNMFTTQSGYWKPVVIKHRVTARTLTIYTPLLINTYTCILASHGYWCES